MVAGLVNSTIPRSRRVWVGRLEYVEHDAHVDAFHGWLNDEHGWPSTLDDATDDALTMYEDDARWLAENTPSYWSRFDAAYTAGVHELRRRSIDARRAGAYKPPARAVLTALELTADEPTVRLHHENEHGPPTTAPCITPRTIHGPPARCSHRTPGLPTYVSEQSLRRDNGP